MNIVGLDHLVLAVADIERTAAFYQRVLGLERVTFGPGRTALQAGDQKINLQSVNEPHLPVAGTPTPGSADFCLVTESAVQDVLDALARAGVDVVAGPVSKTGALGPMTSVYFNDPDGNLVEVARYD